MALASANRLRQEPKIPHFANDMTLHKPALVCHKGLMDDHAFPPNSLEAIAHGLRAGVPHVEIDVVALANDDYLLVHDWTLEGETTGSGPTDACTLAQARNLRIRHDGRETHFRVPVLSDLIALFAQHDGNTHLQIDFKNLIPFPTPEPLLRLLRIIEPLDERVLVSSGADWQLRQLRRMAPWLKIGLEVQLHLDWDDSTDRDPRVPPHKRGAYGYYDDSLIATQRIWSAADYLWDRCQTLIGLVPRISTFYMNHQLLARSLDDGFNWAEALHRAGIKLDAWTMDVTDPVAMANLPHLVAAGVDQITTNTPLALTQALHG
jgi:glycerophosphoryl diester phosphodiesterase